MSQNRPSMKFVVFLEEIRGSVFYRFEKNNFLRSYEYLNFWFGQQKISVYWLATNYFVDKNKQFSHYIISNFLFHELNQFC